uniref:Uncharacterized protein n=1 Tax=Oryza glumipatula TaxID=40148 RepID=A0A0E0AM49_9ORYZ
MKWIAATAEREEIDSGEGIGGVRRCRWKGTTLRRRERGMRGGIGRRRSTGGKSRRRRRKGTKSVPARRKRAEEAERRREQRWTEAGRGGALVQRGQRTLIARGGSGQ